MIFVLPLLAVNIIFFLIPFIKSLYMSLYDWPLLGERTFRGLENFVKAFSDKKFIHSLVFTMEYAVLVTPMLFVVAFAMAILVNRKFRGVGIFRTIYFMPVATVYKGNIIKNLIMDCQSYTKYRPNETTGGIFVSWRRKEELPTGA